MAGRLPRRRQPQAAGRHPPHPGRRAPRRRAARCGAQRRPTIVGGPTLGDWMSIWPARVGRDPRTVRTHQNRIERTSTHTLTAVPTRRSRKSPASTCTTSRGPCSNVVCRRRPSTARSAASRQCWAMRCGSTASKSTPRSAPGSTPPTPGYSRRGSGKSGGGSRPRRRGNCSTSLNPATGRWSSHRSWAGRAQRSFWPCASRTSTLNANSFLSISVLHRRAGDPTNQAFSRLV